MRAEAPSWPVSNFFNVRVCLAFLFIYSLTLLYDIILEIASAFFEDFCDFLWLGVFHKCGYLPCYFAEQTPIDSFPVLWCNNRTMAELRE